MFIIGIEAQTQITIEIGPVPPFKIAYDPINKNMYVANFKGNVSVINTTTNKVVGTIPVQGQLFDIEYDPVNQRMYVTSQAIGTEKGSVSVIDTRTNTVIGSPIAVDKPNGIAYDPEHERMYVTHSKGAVSVINTTSMNLVGDPIPVENGAIDIAYEQENKKNMYVVSIANKTGVSVINTTTNTVVETIPLRNGVWGIAYTPFNKRMLVTNIYNDTVSVIDTRNNTEVGNPIRVGDGQVVLNHLSGGHS